MLYEVITIPAANPLAATGTGSLRGQDRLSALRFPGPGDDPPYHVDNARTDRPGHRGGVYRLGAGGSFWSGGQRDVGQTAALVHPAIRYETEECIMLV